MENNEICRRFDAVESSRTTVEANWDVIRRFVAPFRGQMFLKDVTSEHAIEWDKRELYDDTAIMASKALAASLQQMTSPSGQWFAMRFRQNMLNNAYEPRRWLEESSRRVFAALQDSNFNLEANETYLDLTSFGTAGILEEGVDVDGQLQRIEFTAVPIKECFFEPGHRRVHTFYRRMFWEPSRIIDKFGRDKVPERVIKLHEKADQTKLEVIFCVFARPGKELSGLGPMVQKRAPDQRPYGHKYILRSCKSQLGDEGGYYEMPAFLPRWNTNSESVWGVGPAHEVLATILTTNELAKVQLKAAEKAIDPPMKANEMALLSTPNLSARKLNIMRDINGIEPMLNGGNLSVGDMRLEDQRQMIRQAFHVDDLQLKESPQMTATEVQVRYELMQRTLGVALARLQADFLDPVIERTFNLLLRGNKLEPPPQELLENDSNMEIIYLGPLARAQRMDGVASVERYLGIASGMAEFMPELIERVDPDATSKGLADDLSIPKSYLRSDAALTADRNNRKRDQARQQEAMNQQVEGEAAKVNAEAAAIAQQQPSQTIQ